MSISNTNSTRVDEKITLKDAPLFERFFKTIKKKGGINSDIKREYLIARLLLLLKDFHDFIHSVQKAINYKGLYDELTDQEFEAAKRGVKKIMQKFYLTPNWEKSIIDVICTNRLKVPPPLDPISLQIFNGVPVIQFTYKVSITRLRRWITNNQQKIAKAISQLPSIANIKINSKTIFWGQIVALSRLRGMKKNSDIIKYVDNEISKEDLDDLEDLVGCPDEKDLDNSYKALINTLSKQFKLKLS